MPGPQRKGKRPFAGKQRAGHVRPLPGGAGPDASIDPYGYTGKVFPFKTAFLSTSPSYVSSRWKNGAS